MSLTPEFKIGDRPLRDGMPPYIIAEIGVNHNGDLALAKTTIDAAVGTGADAVKFQTFRAEEFMSDRTFVYEYQSGGERVSESMFEMFKRLELPESWHAELQNYARENGVEFLSSVADPQSADLLASLGAPALKIASEDLINLPLLEHVANLGIPVILSTGMADKMEIDQAMECLASGGSTDILLLHCVSLYPTPYEEANLQRMVSLRERYGVPVGYSDHTVGWEAAMVAASLGAVLVEKHFTLDRSLEGPDHAMSADPGQLAQLVSSVRKAAQLLGCSDLMPSAEEQRTVRQQFRRSVVAAVPIPAHAIVNRDMLCLKRPGKGIPPSDLQNLVGKRTRRPFEIDEPLRWEDLE